MLEPPVSPGSPSAGPVVVHRREAGSSSHAGRWAAAPRRRRFAVVPVGEATALLAGLPVAALRLDDITTSALGEVGIDSIGGVLRLPGRNLASRFPPLLARRIAEFRGAVPEPIVPPSGADLPQAAQAFDFPVPVADVQEGMLIAVIERLLKTCLAPLIARGEGVLSLQVRFAGCGARLPPQEAAAGGRGSGRCFRRPARRRGVGDDSGRSSHHVEHRPEHGAAAPTVVDVGLFRPSASLAHLVELVRLRLQRLRMPVEIEGVAVEVVAVGTVSCRQRLLFGTGAESGGGLESSDADAEVGMLVDRLSGRLGRTAVFEPRPVGDAQPEHAWIAAPPNAGERASRDRVGAGHARAAGPSRLVPAGRRPIWMSPRPWPLDTADSQMVSVCPDGPPVRFRIGQRLHRIVKAHGPERIETAWWRGPTVRRDYYVVETESGERFWVFRRLKDGGWFLHGIFA
jgi:protein ImuB